MRTLPILLVVLAAACGGKKEEAPGKAAGGAPIPPASVAEVNGAVPQELAGKLQFETSKGEDDRFQMLMPKGWKTGVIPGSYQPPDDADLGFMTRYSVSTNCDGTCTAKDWAEVSDKVEFAQLTGGGDFTVEKDEKSDTGRFVVAKHADGSVVITRAWWQKDSPRYAYCRARLDEEAVPAAAAFEQACRLASVTDWK